VAAPSIDLYSYANATTTRHTKSNYVRLRHTGTSFHILGGLNPPSRRERTLNDVRRERCGAKTGSRINFDRKYISSRFRGYPPHFRPCPDSDLTLQTRPDIGRHREPKMSAVKTSSFRSNVIFTSGFRGGYFCFPSRPMSD